MPTMLQRVPPRTAQPTKIAQRRSFTGAADDTKPYSPLANAAPFSMPQPVTAPRSVLQPVPQGASGTPKQGLGLIPGVGSAMTGIGKDMDATSIGNGQFAAAGVDPGDVNSYQGSRYGHGRSAAPTVLQPVQGYRPQPKFEQAADRVLRTQFGAPPNERGQVDVASGGLKRAIPDGMGMEDAERAGIQNTANMPAPVSRGVPAVAAPASIPAPQPAAVQPAQQTEAANPLSGTATTQPQGTTSVLSPAAGLGFSTRGNGVPAGSDAQPGGNVGGSGIYARSFASPAAAGIYSKYVRSLFPDSNSVGAA